MQNVKVPMILNISSVHFEGLDNRRITIKRIIQTHLSFISKECYDIVLSNITVVCTVPLAEMGLITLLIRELIKGVIMVPQTAKFCCK